MEHSKTFGLSGAGRWVDCVGYVELKQDAPEEEDSLASKEGNAAHHVAHMMLLSFKDSKDYLQEGYNLIGASAPNGIIITEEMHDSALAYVTKVIDVVGDDKNALMVEQRVHAKIVDPEAWGTADAIYYDVSTNTLYIWDFKYGHGRVYAYENYQLIGYAQAACEEFNYTKINPRLSLNIVQPRCYDGEGSLLNWTIAFDDIRGYINKMTYSCSIYRLGKSRLATGSWCTNCDVSNNCPAILKAGSKAIDFSMSTIPLNMTPEAASYEKSVIDIAIARLKERKSAVDAQLESRIRGGELIPGYRMKDTMGHKRWINTNPSIFKMMGDMLGIDVMKDPVPLTPTQVISKLKKNKIDESAILPYHETSKTGVKLVSDDGTRAKQIFSQEKI